MRHRPININEISILVRWHSPAFASDYSAQLSSGSLGETHTCPAAILRYEIYTSILKRCPNCRNRSILSAQLAWLGFEAFD